jgi:hypothetical protein
MSFLEERKIKVVNNCKKCGGKNSSCDCYKQFSWDIKKFNSGIPPRFFDIDYNKISLNDKQKSVCDKFINQEIQGLYLEGGLKTLRTELMCSILTESLKNNKKCYFIDSLACAQLGAKQWYNEDSEDYNKLISSDVLALNDIGDERRPESGIVQDVLDNVIRQRLFDMHQVVISSSLTIEQFATIYTKSRFDLIANSFKVISFQQVDIQNIFKCVRNI